MAGYADSGRAVAENSSVSLLFRFLKVIKFRNECCGTVLTFWYYLFCGSLYGAVSRYVLLCNVDDMTDE
jgi:hypothetical protein